MVSITKRWSIYLLLAVLLGSSAASAADLLPGIGLKDTARTTKIGDWRPTEIESGVSKPLGMIQGLGLCIGVFFVGVWFYKKYITSHEFVSSRRIKIIERSSISAKTTLVLAVVDGREILLAVGGESVTSVPYHGESFVQDMISTELEENDWKIPGATKFSPA